MPDPTDSACYRLRGDVDGRAATFVLEPGRHSVGTDPAAGVRLRVRGVSRRHAELVVGGGGIEVRDLESKNGTQINGRRVREGLALAGDELAFGPTTLHVERAAADDARLGLWLDPPSSILEDRSVGEDTTWLARPGDVRTEPKLEWLEAILDRLAASPAPDLDGALDRVAAELGARGAALVEWPPGGGVIALAAAGQVGEVPPRAELPTPVAGPTADGTPEEGWSRLQSGGEDRALDAPPYEGVVVHRELGDWGLILWRRPAERTSEWLSWPEAAWLALVLRLCHAFRRVAPAPDPDGPRRSSRGGDLRLPAHIVRGEAPAMAALYRQMGLLSEADLPVLVLGETGVGKEHLAKTLHDSSGRRGGRFIAVNCAAIPSELLEAELFGIGKGVATGVQARPGTFAQANGGTLFLDEIAEMPVKLQAKLLRALQEKEIHPLGRSPEKVDVRIVAATNTDLQTMIDAGDFRRDLYFRLAGYILRVPPLRERIEDLPRLVGHFLRRSCADVGKSVKGVTVEALRRLAAYPWPGNVRELEHEVRRLAFVCPDRQAIDSQMLAEHIADPATPEPTPPAAGAAAPGPLTPDISDEGARPASAEPASPDAGLVERLDALEVELLHRALRRTAGNQSRAAKRLRISRNSLARRLEKHGIDAADFHG
ncbi:MAG: sigma 54-interacting transcriptional regulator [Acidobacteriota bacterium]